MIYPFCYMPCTEDTKNYIRTKWLEVNLSGLPEIQGEALVMDGLNEIEFSTMQQRQVFVKDSFSVCFEFAAQEGTSGTLFKVGDYVLTYDENGYLTFTNGSESSTGSEVALSFSEATHVALKYRNFTWSFLANGREVLTFSGGYGLANPFEPVTIGPATGKIKNICLYDRWVPYFEEYTLIDKSFGFAIVRPENPYTEPVDEFTPDASGYIMFRGVEGACEEFDLDGEVYRTSANMGIFVIPSDSTKRKISLEGVEGLSWDNAKQMWRVETPGATVQILNHQYLTFRFYIDEDKGGQITPNFYLGDNYAVLGDRRIIWEHDREDSNVVDRLTMGPEIIRINEDHTYQDIYPLTQITLNFTGWISDIEFNTPVTKELRFPPGEVSRIDVYRKSNGGHIGSYCPDAEGRVTIDILYGNDMYSVIHYVDGVMKAQVGQI